MGLLDRWDDRNQQTLEFHQDVAEREGTDDPVFRPVTLKGLLLIVVTLGVARAILSATFGPTITIARLLALTAVAACIFVIDVRRKRRRWERRRQASRTEAG